MKDRFNAIWAEAQRRHDAGETPARVIGGGYTPGAYDVGAGLLPWLTEPEAVEAHQLAQDLARAQRIYDSQAHQRLLAKHAARRAA